MDDFQKAVADWHPTAAGWYWLLLLRQWQVGYIPGDVDAVARVLRLSTKELAAHWPTIRKKFKEAFLVSDQMPVMVNSRLESIYWRQFTAYMRVAERNRANGSAGGRPKGGKSKPKENPVGSHADTESVAKGNPAKTRKEKREKRTPSEDLSGDKSPDVKGVEAPGLDLAGLGARMELDKPFGLCYATLYLLHANMGQVPPPHDDAIKHVKGSTKLLALASELGPETAADLIAWTFEHIQGGKSYPAIYENRAGYLKQMANGVTWVPRRNAPVTGSPVSAKPGLADALADNPWGGEA